MSDADTLATHGRCACGRIRFEVRGPPLIVHACHCTWCRRESGTAHALNGMWEADRVVHLADEPEIVDTPSASGKGQKIARCPTCRVALWSNYAGSGPAARFVRIGTLDEPARFPPDIHIFTSTKLPWVTLPADARAVPEFYRPEDVWSAASLERRRIMRAKAAGAG
ncbi:MAG: GFA family protein [Hyphomicrobiales bacterium]|nr:GFA family protein [Hyphomicrobiales bacterium]MDE2017422.1 GFA family protein [Hyphomicrobiales bacterium]